MSNDSTTSDLLDHLRAFVRAQQTRYDVSSAWLFGSRAYGIPTNDSDIDLAIVTDVSLSQEEELDLIERAKEIDPMLEILIFKRSEFKKLRQALINDIREKGIRIS